MVTLEEVKALIAVLEYMMPEELIAWEESDRPQEHMYLKLLVLEKLARRRVMELEATYLLKR